MLPLSVYAVSAATVQPSAHLMSHVTLLSSSQGALNQTNLAVPVDVHRGGSRVVPSDRRHGPRSGPVTTTTVGLFAPISLAPVTTTTVGLFTPTTVAPVTTTTVGFFTPTSLAPVTTTTVGLFTPTTVAPVTTTTVAPVTTTTVAPVTTTTGGGTSLQPVGSVPGQWNLTFDSEFNGSSLNSSQWSTGWFGSGITKGINSAETECMDPAQVSVSNGELDLTSVKKSETCAGVTQPYTSGMVTTNGLYSFTYGYAEARIWMPGSGSSISEWPAFWTDGQNWPTDGENDIVEGLGGLAQAHFHDASGAAGPLTGGGTFTGGWHTFAADWAPGSVTYYYDGVKIGTFTNGITGSPMYLILDLAINNGAGVPSATMRIDYVRVWQH